MSDARYRRTTPRANIILGVISLVGWAVFMASMITFHYARPDPDNVFDQVLGSTVNFDWDVSLQQTFVFLIIISLVITLSALLLNIVLYLKKMTHIWSNLVILAISCSAFLLYFMFAVRV